MNTERLLAIHFVSLTAIGGLLLGSGNGSSLLVAVAVSISIISLPLVDILKWFAMPPGIAYLCMGAATVYCVSGFWSGVDQQQITAVAQLLVLVQAILHLQSKNLRVFEQLGVFALLELIVASVLNNAVVFGVLLIPFSMTGLNTLILLQRYASEQRSNRLIDNALFKARSVRRNNHISPHALLVLQAPAVALFAATFFYALPKSDARPSLNSSHNTAETGYSDEVRFDQITELLNNPEPVLRLELIDRATDRPYPLREPMYLKGQVLETYVTSPGVCLWTTDGRQNVFSHRALPLERVNSNHAESGTVHDRVDVRIRMKPHATTTLFSIPPYFQVADAGSIQHWPRRWLLRRANDQPGSFEYRFLTHAFHRGLQGRWTRYVDQSSESHLSNRLGPTERTGLLAIDTTRFPRLIALANNLSLNVLKRSSIPVDRALAIERFLSTDPSFTYSLSPHNNPASNVDPLEEFIANSRAGNCQYFAGALALMLRSQGIPARVVTGYKTGEFNAFGNYYLARAMHAHAWVEAYFERHELPDNVLQNRADDSAGVWMRLDATPPSDAEDSIRSVTHAIDFAQNLWDDYVVKMGKSRATIVSRVSKDEQPPRFATPDAPWNGIIAFMGMLKSSITGLGTSRFAVFSMIVLCGGCGVLLLGSRRHWYDRMIASGRSRAPKPTTSSSVVFNELMQLLESIGFRREEVRTVQEFVVEASVQLQCGPEESAALNRLVNFYYASRFGGRTQGPAAETEQITLDLATLQSIRQRMMIAHTRSARKR